MLTVLFPRGIGLDLDVVVVNYTLHSGDFSMLSCSLLSASTPKCKFAPIYNILENLSPSRTFMSTWWLFSNYSNFFLDYPFKRACNWKMRHVPELL